MVSSSRNKDGGVLQAYKAVSILTRPHLLLCMQYKVVVQVRCDTVVQCVAL